MYTVTEVPPQSSHAARPATPLPGAHPPTPAAGEGQESSGRGQRWGRGSRPGSPAGLPAQQTPKGGVSSHLSCSECKWSAQGCTVRPRQGQGGPQASWLQSFLLPWAGSGVIAVPSRKPSLFPVGHTGTSPLPSGSLVLGVPQEGPSLARTAQAPVMGVSGPAHQRPHPHTRPSPVPATTAAQAALPSGPLSGQGLMI